MTFLKKLGCAAAIALAAGAAQANVVMNDWTFNPTGGANGQVINEYLDVNGNAFIQLTPTGANSFSFTEHGVFNIGQADSNGQYFAANFPGGNISLTLNAFGTGTFDGKFTFGGGVVKMYQNKINQYSSTAGIYGADRGTLIGTFDVLAGGGGVVDANGNPTGNGDVSIFATAKKGDLKAGYFFNPRGVDMSTLDNTAFAFTNANPVTNYTANLIGELVCQFSGFTGNGCNGKAYANAPGQHFVLGNNGQFKFADVPEPGSVALFGIALLGLGAMRRRVK